MTGHPDRATSDRTPESDSTIPRSNTPVVLVVEDEANVASMFRRWLQVDYDVAVAHSGTEALDRIDDTVDVVLLDRVLPDTSGRTVLEKIRIRDISCQIVVVSAIEPGVDVLDVGFDDYLTKPTTRGELVTAVERSLTRMRYATKYREFHVLATKLATLESNMDVAELEACSEYTEQRTRFTEIAEELGMLTVDDEEYRDLYQTKLQVLLDSTCTVRPS